jgi:preprotein translocase subunit SecG
MITFVAVVHIIFAVILIALVLVQDSKGGALGIGGSTSNSVLGATGGTTLATQATRVVAVLFAITCIALTYLTASGTGSVLDQVNLPAATAPAGEVSTTTTTPGAAPADTASTPSETKSESTATETKANSK